MKAKVRYMVNSRGNKAPKQLIIDSNSIELFQSYETLIASKNHKNGQIVIDVNALNYSKTTSKFLFLFLNMDRREIERKIEEGVIVVEDLNK